MLKNKKILIAMLLLFASLFIPNVCLAHDPKLSDTVDKIEMTIELKKSGSAIITEKWYVKSYGRHGYIKNYNNINKEEIVDFTISDEKEDTFEYVENNNISLDDNTIRGKYGVVQGLDGASIFWGIVEEGEHQYTLNYTVNNFMKEFKEEGIAKGIKFNFIDNNYATPITLIITGEEYQFNPENTQISNFVQEETIITYVEDGRLKIEFNPYYFTGGELIRFSDDAPFEITYYKKEKKKLLLKKQDYLVVSILVIISILYLIVDLYRIVYEYNLKRKKVTF